MPTLEVTITAANIKKIDPKAYNITDRTAWLKMNVGDDKKESKKVPAPTLDPEFEEVLTFEVTDTKADKLQAAFYMGEVLVGDFVFTMNGLKKMKHNYKMMPVMGGKVDLQLRPMDFGEDDVEEEADDTVWDILG